MAEAKAAQVAGALLSMGGPVGALLGGVVSGFLGKEKVPDTIPLEYATFASDLDAKDVKRYVRAQYDSTTRVIDANIEAMEKISRYRQDEARQMNYENQLKLAQAELDKERQTAKQSRQGTQTVPTYMRVDVTEQLIPALVSQIQAAPTSAPSVSPSNVPTPAPQASTQAGFNYWPVVIGGALILSMVLTGKKGKS